jgi:threonine/homoserine/homoserine lactone efflux protein
MSIETLTALAIFAIVTSITSGPGNAMVLASSANVGFRRTFPTVVGLVVGLVAMLAVAGLGMGTVITGSPVAFAILKATSTAYLLWMAWSLAKSAALPDGSFHVRPMPFRHAVAFPCLNPKAWMMAITAMAVYAPTEDPIIGVATVTALFAAINLPSIAIRAAFGAALQGHLAHPSRLRWFNRAMGALLIASIVPIARDSL